MRRLLALSLLALSPLLVQAKVNTSEGRVPVTAPLALDASRVSRYSSEPAGSTQAPAATPAIGAATSDKKKAASAATVAAVYRPSALTLSARSSYFRFNDAGTTLITDRDGDGQFSEFKIRFDADSFVGDALVYAKLYLRRVGDTGGWKLYHTTGDFWIYGQSATDDYFVTTTLDDGFPAGDYDVLIDLYESGFSDVVATIGPSDTAALSFLPLEEVGLDVPFGLAGYFINNVTTTLITDADNDGYYSKFRVTFDPGADFGGSYVYAIVWVRPEGGSWIKEHTSNDFRVDASGTADAYSFTADWISGYPTAQYDVQIDLYDAATGLLVASAGSERPELSQIPLEDQAHDRFVDTSVGSSSGSTTSYEHGGGAFSMWWVAALAALAVAQVMRQRMRVVKRLRAVARMRAERSL